MKKPLQVERQLQILNLVKKSNAVKVEDLSAMLEVSSNTVRRDLKALEKQGVLRRTQGGAILSDQRNGLTPFETRLKKNAGEKEAIARRAAALVEDNMTIILDAGTTTLALARELRDRRNLTVITNSLQVTAELLGRPSITLILSGGIVHEGTRCLVGIPAEQFFRELHADLLFLSAKGISLAKGLTNQNLHETSTKRAMMHAAARIVVVADHAKFNDVGISQIAPVASVHVVVTDEATPAEYLDAIRGAGVEVLIAPSRDPS